MLEVIDRGRAADRHPRPLLFIHGAWRATWCWDEHFLDYFAAEGYRALALSLRGHGASPMPMPLRRLRIADYVDDVAATADSLPTKPILIGHSMGGFVVQKYLESRDAPAAVLITSAPPKGFLRVALRGSAKHPWLTSNRISRKSLYPFVATPPLVRSVLFTDDTPDAVVSKVASRLQDESPRAYLDMMGLDRVKPELVSGPLLVLGQDRDAGMAHSHVRRTARAHGVEAEFFPGLGHDVMLEPGWRAVAERIAGWLSNHDL